MEAPVKPRRLGTATVVIPCYGYGRYLSSAVAAALDQPGLDVQVVIVDDASRDDSGDIAEDLGRRHPNVEVIRHDRNQGHIATYNDGLEAAHGDWVALVSADDLLTPGCLSRAAALMTVHPSVGFVYGRARHFSGDPPTPRLGLEQWVTWRGQAWLSARCRSGNNVIASPEAVMRTSVLRKIGGYRADLPHSGDLEMWMRAATVADVGYVVGPDQALYRQHDANMHTSVFGLGAPHAQAVDLSHRWAAFQAVLNGPSRSLPSSRRLETVARRTLAAEALDGAASARGRGLDEVALEFDDLARIIGGHPRARRGSARVARRARNRFVARFHWWRLNRVGV